MSIIKEKIKSILKTSDVPLYVMVLKNMLPKEISSLPNYIEIVNELIYDGEIIATSYGLKLSEKILDDESKGVSTARGIVIELVKQHYPNATTLSVLQREYSDYLVKNNICGERYDLKINQIRSMVEKIDCILMSRNGHMRYHEKNISDEEFVEKIDFQRYKGLELSTRRIFHDYGGLMSAFDICNEYELHNYLRKHQYLTLLRDAEINVGRMPTISFGDSNLEGQILSLLREMSPVSTKSFYAAYEERYGTLAGTMESCSGIFLAKYRYKDTFDLDMPILDDSVADAIFEKMDFKWTTLERVQMLFTEYLGPDAERYCNPLNLWNLGYRANQQIIYDKDDSAEECITKASLSKGVVVLGDIDLELRECDFFKTVLDKRLKDLDLVRISNDEFINISKLEKTGIDKKILRSFSEAVRTFVGESFFTLYSIEKEGFNHKLYDYGFDRPFFESILRADAHIEVIKFSNSLLFCTKKDGNRITDLVEDIVKRQKSINIYEIIDYFCENYGLTPPPDYYLLRGVIAKTELYYVRDHDRVYADKDTYYREAGL